MSSSLFTLLEVVGGWSAFCVFLLAVACLVTWWEGRHPNRPACDLLLPRAERAFPVSVVTADAGESVAFEAELACRSCDLEGAWVWPCAPNPKLIFVSGDLERRLDAQRRREAGR